MTYSASSGAPEKQDDASGGAFTLKGVTLMRGQAGFGALLRPTGFTARRTLFTVSDPQRVVALADAPMPPGAKGENGGR